MNNSIHLKNVTKRYKDFALENISLDLPQGCIMGLIGENVPRYEQKTLPIT